MMKVVVDRFGGPDVLRVVEEPTPKPGAGQVLVRITSIGMNHAELMARAGHYKLSSGEPPFTPGIESGGVIDAVGAGVTHRKPGQRVVLSLGQPRRKGDGREGAYRSHIACAAEETLAAPDNLPDEQLGAVWLPYLTAWGCLVWKQDVRHEQTVAIPAASSSVGIAAAQVCRERGVTTIGLTTSPDKVDRLRQMPEAPFDHLVVTRDRDWREDLRRITGNRGVDVFFDPVAAGEYLDHEIRCVAQHGTIWVYGLLAQPGPVDVSPLIHKHAAIRGWVLWEMLAHPDVLEQGCRHILDNLANGNYRLHVERTFHLDDVRAAHEYMEKGQHIGKLVLVP